MLSLVSLLAQVVPTEPATHAGAVDFTWTFIKMLGMLGIVSVLAVLILKYAVPRTGLMKRFSGSSRMRVIERMPLEPKKSVYMVSICGRYFVIGASEHAISLVSEIPAVSIEENAGDEDGPSC